MPQKPTNETVAVPTISKAEVGVPAEPRIITSSLLAQTDVVNKYKLEEQRVDDLKISDYRRMRDNDAEVQMILSATKNTLLSAGFDIEDDPAWEDKENPSEEKQFIEKVLLDPSWKGGMQKDITSVCLTFLRALEEGFIPHEIVYKLGQDNKVYIDKIIPRTTRGDLSDLKMIVDEHGNFLGINQIVTIGSKVNQLIIANESEIHKVINIVWGAEYGSNYGRSAFKPIWYHYDKAHKGMYLNHIGHELGAVKFRHVKKKAMGNSTAEQDNALVDALERTGVNGVALIPEQSYELTFEDVSDAAVLQVGKDMIDYHTTQIAKAWLAQFIELGVSSNTGARALSNDTIAFFKNGLQHMATTLLENPINIIIADLIKINFNRNVFPRLKWKPLQDETVEALYKVFESMVNKGQVTDSMNIELLSKIADKFKLDISSDQIAEEFDKMKEEQVKKDEMIMQQKQMVFNQKPSVKQAKKPTNLSDTEPAINEESIMRALYKDEEKVRLADIARKMDDVKVRAQVALNNKLQKQKTKIIDAYIQALRSGRSSIRKVDIELEEDTYSDELYGLVTELVEAGKIFAANELRSTPPTTTFNDRTWIQDKVDMVTEEQQSRLKFRLQNIALNALQRKQLENEVRLLIEQEYNQFFDSVVPPTLNSVIPESLNYGRSITFNKYSDKIFAYRYTAVIDSKTTEFCRELDGRVFQVGDPDLIMLTPPNHFGCRSILTPITTSEAKQYDIQVNGKPENVPTYSSLNTFKDLDMSESLYEKRMDKVIKDVKEIKQAKENLLDQQINELLKELKE